MKTYQSRFNKYPVLIVSKDDKTFYRVIRGELTGLNVTTADRLNMKAVKVEHERVKGFRALTVVSPERSIDWIIDRLINDVRLAF